jgi:hypothetical protein
VKRLGRQTTGCTSALCRLPPLHFSGVLMKIDAESGVLYQQIGELSENYAAFIAFIQKLHYICI